MIEKENIIRILQQTLYAIKNDNPLALRDLSDQTIHSATTGDPDNILVAVIVYSLSKIMSRQDYRTLKGWESFKKITISSLKCSINDLENRNNHKFQNDFIMIKKAINKISGKLRVYIDQIFKNSKIAKASRIHEHGISAEKTAKMLGITLFDLQNYTGQTGISEVGLNRTIDIKTRVKYIQDIFQK